MQFDSLLIMIVESQSNHGNNPVVISIAATLGSQHFVHTSTSAHLLSSYPKMVVKRFFPPNLL